jgi:hypothetical protein
MQSSSRFLIVVTMPLLVACVTGFTMTARQKSMVQVPVGTPGPVLGRYPDSSQRLEAMSNQQDEPAMRAHAWAILNVLTNAGGGSPSPAPGYTPAWENQGWENKCNLGLAPGNGLCGPPTPSGATTPCSAFPKPSKLLMEAPVQQLSGPGLSAMSSVWYSAAAAAFIRTHCLNTPDGLRKLAALEEGTGASNPSNQFPTDAVIVKLIWALPDDGNPVGTWSTNMMTRGNPNDEINLGFPNSLNNSWPHVIVNTDLTVRCASRNYDSDKDPGYSSKTDAVPINCFYHRKITCQQMPDGVGEVLGWRKPCASGQTSLDVILVGFHVITAELKDWVWSTFWWTNHPDSDPLQADRPENLRQRGPWGFYSMNTTMSLTTPADIVDHGPKICFNPYLEGPQSNGPVSNCMFCHQMAVYRSSGKPAVTNEIAAGHPRRCAYLTPDSPTCQQQLKSDASGSAVLLPGDKYFQDATRTHFLWSLAVAQDADAVKEIKLMQIIEAKEIAKPQR